ncbi:MAG: HesA/MoeB/ThiF family protein [Pirellulaceae bacterium]
MPDEPIVIDDDDRYSRLRLIGWWDQEKLAKARIMVVGAGALGNEVLKNLALVGVGKIFVIDFDHIERSNLTRSVLFRQRDCGRSKAAAAADAIHDLNPDTQVIALQANVLTDVGLGLFRDVDVVIGCLDNREARWWVNRCCWKVGTPWIDGGIQEINGVVKVFVPPDGACYECTMTENDYRLINLRYSCPLLRQEDLQAGKVPTAPTISSMIGGLQAQEALKLIHDLPVLAGEALIYNGVASRFYRTQFQRRDDCMSHETYAAPQELPLRAAQTSAAQLLAAACDASGMRRADSRLILDRDLIVAIDCVPCGTRRRVMKTSTQVGVRQAVCPTCQQIARPHITHVVAADSELADTRLCDLGIPPYDMVRIESGAEEGIFWLTGDRDSVIPAPEQGS